MRGFPGSTVALEPARLVRIEQRRGSTAVVTRYRGTGGAAVHQAMTGLWASPLGRDREGGPGVPQPLGFDERTGELTPAWGPGGGPGGPGGGGGGGRPAP